MVLYGFIWVSYGLIWENNGFPMVLYGILYGFPMVEIIMG